MPEFNLTDDHIKLLRRAAIEWDADDAYRGHFAQHSKRPYGNSGVLGDVREIVGRDLTDEEAISLHEDTADALEVVLAVGEFRPGTYVCDWPSRNWRLLEHKTVPEMSADSSVKDGKERHAQRHWLETQARAAVELAMAISNPAPVDEGLSRFWLEIELHGALQRAASQLAKAEMLHRRMVMVPKLEEGEEA